MNAISGRQEEQKELYEAFNSKKAELIIVYGRRRVGKTFLIYEYFKQRNCLFFNSIGIQDGLLKDQLSEFAKAIGNKFYNGASIAPATSWMGAFDELNKAINSQKKDQKIILFFDELPWMVTKRSRLLNAFDYYWNQHWSKNPDIKLIICGSSASWIIKNIIHHTGGLHNRYTRSILLKPFTLSETKDFLGKMGVDLNNKQILQLYMAMGGIPHYLIQAKNGMSSAQIINNLCFKESGILFSEFDKLFKSLFDDSKTYIELIRIISSLREGVSRSFIEEKSKLSAKGGTLSDRLKDLELAGFIKEFLPMGHHRQGIYYRIIDEYCYFYLKWIEPARRSLVTDEVGHTYWLNKMNTPEYFSWMGYAFESVCYKHLAQIKKILNFTSIQIGTWRYVPRKDELLTQGTQIDLIFERADDAISLCEIKCTEKPFLITKEYSEKLISKINVYKQVTQTTKQIFMVMISANGIKDNTYSKKLINQIICLEDLFK